MFLNQNGAIGNAAYDNRCFLIKETIDGSYFHDITVDLSITDLGQTGSADTFIAYLYTFFRTPVYLRIDIFFKASLSSIFERMNQISDPMQARADIPRVTNPPAMPILANA